MTSTYSPLLRLELMATGDQSGTWGTTTNVNLGTLLEQAIAGVLSVAQGDVANLTLTANNGASDQSRNAVINVTGALTANRNVVVPTSQKVYLVSNQTSGGFSLVFKTAAGTGVTVPPATSRWVYCDGTNVVDALGVQATAFGGTGLSTFGAANRALYSTSASALTAGTLPLAAGGTSGTSEITAWDALSAQGTDIASATSINLTTATGPVVNVTGTVTTTGITLAQGSSRIVRATGAWPLTASASLIINGNSATNYTAQADDVFLVTGYASSVVRMWLIATKVLPAIYGGTGLSALGTGVATWMGTPSSANLRAAMTDETGTGALYFQGGDLGTPSAGVLTNATGTAAGLTAGAATTATTASAANAINSATTTVNVSSATAPSTGQILTATDSTHATWQAPAAGGQPIPTSSTFAVGTLLFARQTSGSTVTDGSTVSGASLGPVTGPPGTLTSGGAQSGTWKNVSGASVLTTGTGAFVRTA